MVNLEKPSYTADSYLVFTQTAEPLAVKTAQDPQLAGMLFRLFVHSPDPNLRALAAFISDDVEKDPEVLEGIKYLEDSDPDLVVRETAQEMSRINTVTSSASVATGAPQEIIRLNPDTYHHAA